MQILSSSKYKSHASNSKVHSLLLNNSQTYIRSVVERISIPRHYIKEHDNNLQIRNWIEAEFEQFGLHTIVQGKHKNVIAVAPEYQSDAKIVIGAHFDSVPGSPGADDNASAVAAMLACAKLLTSVGKFPILYVAFNREEDNLKGSKDFVDNYLPTQHHTIEMVHILEMIGYCDTKVGSQKSPQGLPIKLSDKGDFISVVMNRTSNHFAHSLLETSGEFVPDLELKVLKVYNGMEKYFPHLSRSDHSAFWQKDIPATMWTDTSEFRNPHYHKASDVPDTLDFVFLKRVTDMLIAHLLRYFKVDLNNGAS